MVGRFLKYLEREVSGLHEAAYLLAFFTFLSQLVAIFRDRLFAHEFGASAVLDIYYAAFRVPDVIFASVASLVSISVLVPLLVEAGKDGVEGERKFIDSIFSFFALLIIIVSAVAFLLAPKLLGFLFPSIVEAGNGAELILAMRIMLLSPILLGFSNFFASVTQVRKRFVAYALAPVFYNLGIVVGAFFFYPMFGQKGLAFGVVLGALLHMLIQLPYLFRNKLTPRFLRFDFAIIKKVISLSIYRTIALSSTHVALIILTAFASAFAVGSVAVFNFAWNMQSVPLAMVGVSYSMAIFPTISRLFAERNKEGFVREVAAASRHIVFWSLPIMVMFIVLRAQIVRTILGSGAFSWSDTRLTAAALALFTISILAQSLSLVFVRSYYAAGNTKTPLIINVTTSICIIIFAYTLTSLMLAVPFIRDFLEALLRVGDLSGTAVLVLPLAYSLALLINLGLYVWRFEFDFGGFVKPVMATFFHSFSASVIGGFAAYLGLNFFDKIFDLSTVVGVFLQGLLSGLIGLIVLIAVLYFLKSNELLEVGRALHHRIWKKELAVGEQEVSL